MGVNADLPITAGLDVSQTITFIMHVMTSVQLSTITTGFNSV